MSVGTLCGALGITRQAYYQERERQAWETVRDAQVVSLVRMIRCRHPRLGVRKVLVMLRPQLEQEGLTIGRDRAFRLLREAGLLVKQKRQPHRTTWAGRLRVPNAVAGLRITGIDQVWVTDITYVQLQSGRYVYWFVVMDLYSRAILGEVLGPTLEAQHALVALQRAAEHARSPLRGLIHHSDHGVQYTSRDYQNWLLGAAMVASMGEVGNSYDNAYAERVIGTLKREYGLGLLFVDEAQAQRATTEGAYLYNHERPHQALGYATPMAVYTGQATAKPFSVHQYEPAGAAEVPVDLPSESGSG